MRVADLAFAWFVGRRKFFLSGWGEHASFTHLWKEEFFSFPSVHPLKLHFEKPIRRNGYLLREAHFKSPCHEILPPSCKTGYALFVEPTHLSDFPVFIHFAMTGDEGYDLRLNKLAIPLAKRGIGSVIMAHPFYGRRRPAYQTRYYIDNFVDFSLMCMTAVMEGEAVVAWLKAQKRQVGVTGISMGGYVAALVASHSQEEVAVVPCMAPHAADVVFGEGILSPTVAWHTLQNGFPEKGEAQALARLVLKKTDLRNFDPPQLEEACIIVAGREDAIVPAHSTDKIAGHWKKAELRWLPGGHVTSYLFGMKAFTQAISDASEKIRSFSHF